MAMAFFSPALHRDNVLRATITLLKLVAVATGTVTDAVRLNAFRENCSAWRSYIRVSSRAILSKFHETERYDRQKVYDQAFLKT